MTDSIANEKTVIRKDGARTGARIGRYTLGRRLGIGGMAEVYLAEQDGPQQFRKRVVIKRILPALAADAQFVQMFVREAQVAARLAHGNIVQILELGEHTDSEGTEYFIAMEHIDGLTLQRLAQTAWDDGKAVPVDVVLRACADAARGLHAAHTLKDESGKLTPLVHRDISPDNLMVSRDGVTKVLDFGIAKGDLGGPKTKTGNVRGKIPYMSPEQVTGQALDARSDLYSLGVAMYYLLCGERPFDRATDYHTMQALMGEAPKPPRSLNPAIPEEVEKLILRLIDKDRDKRPSSAADLADELEALTQPGTGAGRKTMIAFVSQLIEKTDAAGNPLSEADGARATVPLENAAPMVDASALSLGESVVPRQVTIPSGAEAAPDAKTESPTSPLRPSSGEGAPVDVTATITGAAVAAAPAQLAEDNSAPSPPRAPSAPNDSGASSASSHPVVELLTPRREGTSPALVLALVVVGMAAVAVPLGYLGLKLAQASGDKPVSVVDAGVEQARTDAGVTAPVDAGSALVVTEPDAGIVPVARDAGMPALADAGTRAPSVPDAGPTRAIAVDAVVDAGATSVVAAATDAGPAAQKPNRLVVKAIAPATIRWELDTGAALGRGTTTLSLPRGTKSVIARDAGRQRKDTLAIALDAGNDLKGSVEYTALLTATLKLTNVGDAKVLLGDEDLTGALTTRAVPGSYNLRVFVGDDRTVVKVQLRMGETTTVDVQKALKPREGKPGKRDVK